MPITDHMAFAAKLGAVSGIRAGLLPPEDGTRGRGKTDEELARLNVRLADFYESRLKRLAAEQLKLEIQKMQARHDREIRQKDDEIAELQQKLEKVKPEEPQSVKENIFPF